MLGFQHKCTEAKTIVENLTFGTFSDMCPEGTVPNRTPGTAKAPP